jgi:hypothetical protein
MPIHEPPVQDGPVELDGHRVDALSCIHSIHHGAFMKTLTIRNVPKGLAAALDRERRRRDASLNQTVVDLLSRQLGVDGDGPPSNGLARLAGTWNAEEHRAFEEAVRPLDTVDAGMWK